MPSAPGAVVAVAMVIASLAPTLLPRPWYVQGAISGLLLALGYGLGVLAASLVRWGAGRLGLEIRLGAQNRTRLRIAIAGILLISAIWSTIANIQSQAITASLVELKPHTPVQWLGITLIGILVAAIFLGSARLLRAGYRRLQSTAMRFLTASLASVVAVVVVALAAGLFADVVIVRAPLNAMTKAAAQANQATPHVDAPTLSTVSGGPGSLEAWSSLGFEGMRFTALASKAADIAAVTGAPAQDPIRVYIGLPDNNDLQGAADAVVAELKRTGGFDRKVLAVFTATGTGWINAWAPQSIEFLTGGDCAIATMQYSYLTSYQAFVADRETPAVAGKILFDTVYAAWSQLPADARPQLVVSGESLGSYGSQAAFTDVQDMLARAQGGVWSGTPAFTPTLQELYAARMQGSPEVLPVIDSGRHIRFASDGVGLDADYAGRPFGAWESPRFVYLQHASDPVVWWSSDLLLTQPDWLREPRGSDVLSTIRWWPVVSFWQVTGDMAAGTSPPPGHGHKYGSEELAAWGAVLGGDPGTDYAAMAKAMDPYVSYTD